MKKTRATLSDILNRHTKNSLPDTMTINGLDCKDKQIIAEQFNSLFATIGELNERNIHKHNGSNFRDYFKVNLIVDLHSTQLTTLKHYGSLKILRRHTVGVTMVCHRNY